MVGSSVAGRYRIDAVLGRGGQADVYLARDEATKRPVALKILRAGAAPFEERVRFRREFTACARIRHPGVIRLYDFGEMDDGRLYYAMEFLECPSLGEILDREGPQRPEFVLEGARQMADALACLHDAGVIHRDLKPANVLVDGSRFVLTDFGLARDVDLTRVTETGCLLGTPRYMAPEQARGCDADVRTDLFQLGVILFEMLTGRPAFGGTNLPDILSAVLTTRLPPPSTLCPGLDGRWDHLVRRLTAPDADLRPPSAAAVLAELESLKRGDEPPAPVATGPHPRVAGRTAPGVASGTAGPSPSRRLLPVGLVATVAAVALLFVLRTPRAVYSALDLRLEPRPAGLTARWSSDAPYPSRVRLRLPDGSGREVSAGATSTISHVVVVEGLPEGGDVGVAVVYPSGALSMEVAASAGRSVRRVVASTCTDDGLEVALEVRPPRGVRLRLALVDGGGLLVPVARGDDPGVLHVHAAVAPATVASAVLEDEAGAPVADLGGLLGVACEAVLRRLPAGTLPRILDGMGTVVQPSTDVIAVRFDDQARRNGGKAELERQDQERIVDQMQRLLDERLSSVELKESWEELSGLAPLALETRLLDPELAQRVLESILDVSGLFSAMAIEGLPPSRIPLHELPPLPSLGRHAVALAGCDTVVVTAPPAPLEVGLPLPLSPRGMVTRVEGTATVGEPRDVLAAEVTLEIRGFVKLPLLVLVDGRPVARIMGSSTYNVPGVTSGVVHQRVPPFVLRGASVTVAVVPELLLGRRTNNRVLVGRVSLGLLRR